MVLLNTTARRTSVAGVISCLVVAGALSVPATASAALPHALAAAGSMSSSSYNALSDGTLIYANALNATQADVAKVGLGQSGAATAHNAALATLDQLKQPLITLGTAGKTAYGHGTGLGVGLMSGQSVPPAVAVTTAEATSPAPSNASSKAGSVPLSPLATADVAPSSAAANTTADGSCVIGKDISNGAAHIANADVLSAPGVTVIGLGNTSDTVSHTKLVTPTTAAGTTVTTGKSGLLGQTTQVLAPITLLAGTPAAVVIKVLAPLQLSAEAGGEPGTSVISYGAVGATKTTHIVSISIAGSAPSYLNSEQVFGTAGIVLPLGVADITIGGLAHSLTGLEGTSTTQAANGTMASAAADFIRITVPGKLALPASNPIASDSPLAPLNSALNPLLSGLNPVLSALQTGLNGLGLGVADVRIGHLEASAVVPVGGIDCTPDDNPLSESRKDVSALHVQPGSTFNYDIRVPNRGTTPISNVKVVDTYPAELSFVSSVPAAVRNNNQLTFDLGTLQPNDFRTIQMVFKVPTSAKAGTVYHNSALITGTYQGQPVSFPVAVDGPTVGLPRIGDCNLSGSTKFASNLQVKTGENFAYLVNVLNSGGKPCDNVAVTDALIGGVTFVSCTDGCTHSGQNVTWNLGTLGAGDSRVVAVVVKVVALKGTLPNTALVTSPSGTGGRPYTAGPTITNVSVPSDGNPADGPNGSLPRTGLPAGLGALGLIGLLGAGVAMRLRRRETAV